MRFRPRLMIATAAAPPPPRDAASGGFARVPIGARPGVLEWRQCGRWWSPFWEMWSEGERLATFRVVGALRRRAVVDTGDTRWSLRRRGFLGLHEVFREGEREPVVRYRPGWLRGGRIERAAGPALRWKPALFARSGSVVDAEGFELLGVRMRHAFIRYEGEQRLEAAGRRLPDAEALLVLVWWLMLDAPRHHGH